MMFLFQGGDDVLMCANLNDHVEVHHYWTEVPYHTPSPKSNSALSNMSTHLVNHRVACRFTRPLKVHGDDHSLDLNSEWYQLYAWGPTYNSEMKLLY